MENVECVEKVLDTRTAVLKLKQQIAEYAAEQRQLRKDNPQWSNGLQQTKMGTRAEIRRRHLTVAYLCGVPYKVLEKHCHEHDDLRNRTMLVATGVSWALGINLGPKEYLELMDKIKAWMSV